MAKLVALSNLFGALCDSVCQQDIEAPRLARIATTARLALARQVVPVKWPGNSDRLAAEISSPA